jgi:hypothetical protein
MTDMTQKTRRVPTPEEIASAYESLGGCDECLGPADAFEDRLNSSSIPDPSGHPDLLRLTVVDFAGCSRCRTRWSVQVGVSYRRRTRCRHTGLSPCRLIHGETSRAMACHHSCEPSEMPDTWWPR